MKKAMVVGLVVFGLALGATAAKAAGRVASDDVGVRRGQAVADDVGARGGRAIEDEVGARGGRFTSEDPGVRGGQVTSDDQGMRGGPGRPDVPMILAFTDDGARGGQARDEEGLRGGRFFEERRGPVFEVATA